MQEGGRDDRATLTFTAAIWAWRAAIFSSGERRFRVLTGSAASGAVGVLLRVVNVPLRMSFPKRAMSVPVSQP